MSEKKIGDRKYTHEEYDRLTQELDYKIEYHAGAIRAMAVGSPDHSRAKTDFSTELAVAFKGTECNVFDSDLAVDIEKYDRYLYPDISVVCGENEFRRNNYLKNPSIIVEVLSESTADYDKGMKMFYYFSLPSLKEYVIVDVKQPLIIVHSKQNGKWTITVTFGLKSKIYLPNFDVSFEMKDIYRRVEGL